MPSHLGPRDLAQKPCTIRDTLVPCRHGCILTERDRTVKPGRRLRAMEQRWEDQGRVRQKRRTRRAILAAASALIGEGKRPSVEEVADAAEVSRRTAYRYF